MCRAGPWSHEVWWEHSLRHTGLSHWFAALLAVPSKALGALFFVSNHNWLHGAWWPTLPRSVTRVGFILWPAGTAALKVRCGPGWRVLGGQQLSLPECGVLASSVCLYSGRLEALVP